MIERPAERAEREWGGGKYNFLKKKKGRKSNDIRDYPSAYTVSGKFQVPSWAKKKENRP